MARSNHYTNAVECRLSDIVTPEKFRTVLYEQFKLPCGITEIPAEISLKPETVKKLSFPVPSDGMLYGFARIKPFVRQKFDTSEAKIYINDWDDRFVLVFDLRGKGETAFYITDSEVVKLLEGCCRVPEQASVK